MSVYIPEATPVLDNTKVKFVTALANPTAPGLASEVNAASGIEASGFVRDFGLEIATNTGQAPNRLAMGVQLPQLGRTSISAMLLAYIYDPQGDPSDPDNALKAKLLQGSLWYAIVRKGIPFTVPFIAGDKVEVWRVGCGRQNKVRSSDDEFAEFEIQQQIVPKLTPWDGVLAA